MKDLIAKILKIFLVVYFITNAFNIISFPFDYMYKVYFYLLLVVVILLYDRFLELLSVEDNVVTQTLMIGILGFLSMLLFDYVVEELIISQYIVTSDAVSFLTFEQVVLDKFPALAASSFSIGLVISLLYNLERE